MARNLIDALGASPEQLQQILDAIESPDQYSVMQIGAAIQVGLELKALRGEIPD